ncbi:uncharacterized protein LOC121709746 [Alosa sapidissima]|uniref:uncharacterized protein LOC121709746 n=1 Tax=Alosa sapidissima TaxID=34773 RepID=UPI001C0A53C7|nr:uncharacterized protein LOC121709746 [Alosa sapidissima]
MVIGFIFMLLPIMVVSSDTPIRAVMGGITTLTAMTACMGERKWTVKKGAEYRHVSTCKEETCSVEPRFRNRAEQRGTNLTISPVLFDDDGFYIYSCDGKETAWIPLHLESCTSTAVIAAGGDLSMSLCSLDQVKLNFTPRGSSAAETVFIMDNGQVFVRSQASRGMTLSVQNNTAVLSGVLEGGLVTGTDSKTDKKLFEVIVTITGSNLNCY